jgi:hypothetical protein
MISRLAKPPHPIRLACDCVPTPVARGQRGLGYGLGLQGVGETCLDLERDRSTTTHTPTHTTRPSHHAPLRLLLHPPTQITERQRMSAVKLLIREAVIGTGLAVTGACVRLGLSSAGPVQVGLLAMLMCVVVCSCVCVPPPTYSVLLALLAAASCRRRGSFRLDPPRLLNV